MKLTRLPYLRAEGRVSGLNRMRQQIKFDNKLWSFPKKIQSDQSNVFCFDLCSLLTVFKAFPRPNFEWAIRFYFHTLEKFHLQLEKRKKNAHEYNQKVWYATYTHTLQHISFLSEIEWNDLLKNQSNVVMKIKLNIINIYYILQAFHFWIIECEFHSSVSTR